MTTHCIKHESFIFCRNAKKKYVFLVKHTPIIFVLMTTLKNIFLQCIWGWLQILWKILGSFWVKKLKAQFTPRTITIKITILASTPVYSKCMLVCRFKFSSSSYQDWFRLGVNVCIVHQLEKIVLKVTNERPTCLYRYSCGVDSAIL